VLAAAYDAMQGPDAGDPACRQLPAEAVTSQLDAGTDTLRIAQAIGYFETNAQPEVAALVSRAADALGANRRVEIPEPERARVAAMLITRAEAANLHLPNLRTRANDFNPLIRDRLLANALIPAAWYIQAQRFRRWHHHQLLRLFESIDVILAPATASPAHRIGEQFVSIRGNRVPVRTAAGLLVAPFSPAGVPIISAPVGSVGGLPVGIQIIAPPWREDLCFRVARALEKAGVSCFAGTTAQ